MTDDATLKRHADLFDRTATRLGLDLQELALSGAITVDEIGEAVLRCTECSNPEDCAHWLDRNEGEATAAPVYCRNTDLMERLKTS